MTNTLDLGVDEAYQHSAEVEREMETLGMERIAVNCKCGKLWIGVYPKDTYDLFENDEQAKTAPYLEAWAEHVRKACDLAPVDDRPDHGWRSAVESGFLLEIIEEILEERDEARAERDHALGLPESEEIHELCSADIEDLKGRLRTARRRLVIGAVLAAALIAALLVAVVVG